jgi:hypothetical protein
MALSANIDIEREISSQSAKKSKGMFVSIAVCRDAVTIGRTKEHIRLMMT